jgi:carbon-monoxide dehydrogenase medium subunit
MYAFYVSPDSLEEALTLKAQHGADARVIAGGTDLLVELSHDGRRTPAGGEPGLIDLTRVRGLAEIDEDARRLHLGPLVTHNQCVTSDAVATYAFPLARACWEVGAPQIRNRATVAGNIITASPANDTIVPLLALNATVTLTSAARGERSLPLASFMTDFRRVDLADDEILTRISIPKLEAGMRGAFIKLGLRRAQAISVVNAAVIMAMDAQDRVVDARIALGAVAPVIVRAAAAETYLLEKALDDDVIAEAARRSLAAAQPIDDLRGSAGYRLAMVEELVKRALTQLRDGSERGGWLAQPVTLRGHTDGRWPVVRGSEPPANAALVNGQPVTLAGGMSLLDSLRAAGFVGVKEGCAEGECGACTVFLDGMAVMACMVPAERATGSEVVTVEGLGAENALHPVQAALVESGGIQCGYCTPGFVMSAAKLLEEIPTPSRAQAAEAFTGNFCRCTGYRKILDAVAAAPHATGQEQDLNSTNA